MTNRPMAAVFQTDDGGTHELWVPPGFAVVLTNGGILVTCEEYMVTTLLSVRPLPGGEAHAPEDEDGQGDRDPDLDEPDDGGFLEDPSVGDGGGDRLDAEPGTGLREESDRERDCTDEPDCSCPCTWCRAGDCDDCDGPWKYRSGPGPDDAPGVTV